MPLIIIGSSLFIHSFVLAFTHQSSSTSALPFSSLCLHNLGLAPRPISGPKSLHATIIVSGYGPWSCILNQQELKNSQKHTTHLSSFHLISLISPPLYHE